jgi:hypothetical protein
MKLTKLLGSKRSRQLSVISTLAEAAMSFKRGQKKVGALLVGVAALSYKRSELGYLAQIAVKLFEKKAK